MTAFAQAVTRYRATRTETRTETDAPLAVAVFCGAGLVVSLICVACGLDLGADFFDGRRGRPPVGLRPSSPWRPVLSALRAVGLVLRYRAATLAQDLP